ncbi:hypothetical protein Rhe02_19850 [Rhizocola hellebori]|uniref:Uncharacterized protein n=1 Tax=Rhizocola hellebori TaxID=1392758 RepID=A0A8J3Q4P9_9ACTN|nr:hypothetical protein [Rhizocola hellebori]GIH03918.1 hypothetical protein Rhe02_19850 [Rhizocola hellebori]
MTFEVSPAELTAGAAWADRLAAEFRAIGDRLQLGCQAAPKVGNVQAAAAYQQAHFGWAQTRFEDLMAGHAALTKVADGLREIAARRTGQPPRQVARSAGETTVAAAYFGVQDVRVTAQRVLEGDPADLRQRAKVCQRAAAEVAQVADQLSRWHHQLEHQWDGVTATLGLAVLKQIAAKHAVQAVQLRDSMISFAAVAGALKRAQAVGKRLVLEAARRDQELNSTLEDIGVVIENYTGVDVESFAADLIVRGTRKIRKRVVGINARMNAAVRQYEAVLRAQAAVLAGMPGAVRADAGPEDAPGDAQLRQVALFRSVYGREPGGSSDRLMARALDLRTAGDDGHDPQARVVVVRIEKVPGAGLVHGAAFIASDEVFNPRPNASLFDRGDNRGFSPEEGPERSRTSFYVDYEAGVVVARQNTSHDERGEVQVGDPIVGVEQDGAGRVRLRMEATNPLAPGLAQTANFSVRSDLVIDPHAAPASVSGEVSQFPSWEVYQRHDETVVALLQRPEDALPAGLGPMLGLPQPTVRVGEPGVLEAWRRTHHPGQGHFESDVDRLLQYPLTRDDPFFRYPLPPAHYPTVDSAGRLQFPSGNHV